MVLAPQPVPMNKQSPAQTCKGSWRLYVLSFRTRLGVQLPKGLNAQFPMSCQGIYRRHMILKQNFKQGATKSRVIQAHLQTCPACPPPQPPQQERPPDLQEGLEMGGVDTSKTGTSTLDLLTAQSSVGPICILFGPLSRYHLYIGIQGFL